MKKEKDLINNLYKKREKNARKYDHGLVIIVGGSKVYTGSPILSAMASLRAGADVTQIVAPERVANVAAAHSPDLITFPLKGDYLTSNHLADLLAITRSGEDVSRGKIAVVLGGGIGRDEETKKTVREYVKKISIPVVVDADAIYAFENEKTAITEHSLKKKNILFTPHLYEFFVLTGINIENIPLKERGFFVKEAAKKLSSGILLKGEIDFMSDGEKIKENKVSVPYMTIGGTGDVLAGIAGALLARGVNLEDAGIAAAMINTLAGKMAAENQRDSLLATDVIEKIHKVIKPKR